jgi:hypothetical protein
MLLLIFAVKTGNQILHTINSSLLQLILNFISLFKYTTMRTSKNTITGPELFVDDHHGQYMGQIAWQQLAERYKLQAKKQLSAETIASIEAGPDDEYHHESCDSFTNCTFKTPTGQKLSIQYAEGGMWIIPACFTGKKAEEFFGC